MKCVVLLLITFAAAKSFPLKNEEDTELQIEVMFKRRSYS